MHITRRGKRVKGCASTTTEYKRPQALNKRVNCVAESTTGISLVVRQAPKQLSCAYPVDGRVALEGAARTQT